MTRRTNARVAGFTFLIYIAVSLIGMVLFDRAAGAEGTAAKLAGIAQHASIVRVAIILELIGCICALVLAVTLYSITRDQDSDLAMLGLTFRVAEGVIGAVSLPRGLGRLWLATAARPDAPDPAVLRGRMVPVALAWLGVLASILVIVCLPLQLIGILRSPITDLMWLPMLAFEVTFALWLIIKGVAIPPRRQSA